MSLFAFTSKLIRNRQTKQRRRELGRTLRRLTQVETLEDRRLLAAIGLGDGYLTIGDTAATGTNNMLTAKLYNDGMNDYFELTDTSDQFSGLPVTSPASTLTNDNKTLRVPFSAITGSIFINGHAGDDSLSVDFTGGTFPVSVAFNGGASGDNSLTLAGGGFFSGTFEVTNNYPGGTIDLTGNSQIIFNDLQSIDTTGTAIDDLIFTFDGGAETITLTDAAGGTMKIDTTMGVSVAFANPSSSLTINAGSGDDAIEIANVDSAFRGAVTINGDDGTDAVNWNAAATLGSGVASGDVNVVAETISISNLIAADTGRMIAVSLTATSGVTLADAVITSGGALTVNADSDGDGSGSLHVAEAMAGSWVQRGADFQGAAAGDQYGWSVALSSDGSTLVVGAPYSDEAGNGAGQARVYDWTGSAWVQRGLSINGETPGDSSGYSLALSSDGNTLVVGAPSSEEAGIASGQARVYDWSGTAWVQRGLNINGEAALDYAGLSLALSSDGNTLVVGAPFSEEAGYAYGQARVYDWSGSAWVQRGLNINGEAFGDSSGWSLALSSDGNTLVVGALGNTGQARVYDWSGSAWVQRGVDIQGEAVGDQFGYSVALSGDANTLVVGANYNDSNGVHAGHARVYDWSGSAWAQRGAEINGETAGDESGWSVALSDNGNTLVVGAPFSDGNGAESGQARIYDWNGSVWVQRGLDIDGVTAGDTSGSSLAMSSDGNTLVVGAPSNDNNSTGAGHARVYDWRNSTSDGSVSTSGGNITITAADANIQGTIDAAAGSVSFLTSTVGRTIDLGASTGAGQFVLTDNELDLVHSTNKIVVGTATAGDVVFTGIVSLANADTLEIITRGTVNDTGTMTVFTDVNLAIDASSGVGTTSPLEIAVIHFEAEGGSGGVNAVNAGALTIGGVTTSLNGVSTSNAAISVSAASEITVNESISSGGGDVILTATNGVTLNDAVSTGGGAVTIDADSDGDGIGSLNTSAAAVGGWVQRGMDIDGEAAGDNSAYSVAVSSDGNTLAVGARLNDGNGTDSGQARVYDWIGTTWVQRGADLDGEAAGDLSGFSVALSSDGNTLAVGAYRNDGRGIDSGQARVYRWSGSEWVQLGLDIDGEAAFDFFGHSVALSDDGDTLVVGATLNDDAGQDAGHSRIYDWSGLAWVQRGLAINGEAAFDQFGQSAVSSNGNSLAVGAPKNDGNGNVSGHVRVYDWSGSAWAQRGTDIDGESPGDESGFSLALSDNGNTLAVGARRNDASGTDAGHTRVYDWSGSAWLQRGLDIDGTAAGEFSSFSVALSADGNTLIVGAPANDDAGADAGQSRVYDWSGSDWILRGVAIDGEVAGDFSGYSVALSDDGNTLVVGAPQNDGNGTDSGQTRVYDWSVSAAAGGIATSGGHVAIRAADVNLQGTIDAGSVGFQTSTVGRTIDLGASGGTGQFVLSDEELDLVTSVGIAVGATDAGNVVFAGPVSLANVDNLALFTGGDISQGFVGNAFTGVRLVLKGNLAPALAGRGTFDVDGLVAFDATAGYEVNLNGIFDYDKLVVSGGSRTITLGGAELFIALDTVPAVGSQETFTIIDSTGSGSAVNGTFTVGGVTLNNGDTFTVGSTIFRINYNPAGATGDVTLTEAGDDDRDGVSDEVESAAPNGGDGNADGIADNLQDHVASLPNATNGSYVTVAVAASGGGPAPTLGLVSAIQNPSPADAPNVAFPTGFVNYSIENVTPGGSVVVTMIHDTNEAFSTFWKYGPTPGNLDSHWYEFLYDGQTGAVITGDTITLHFVDGLRGDDDLTANGVIVDPGAPAISPPTFATTFSEDSLPVLIQDAGLTLEGASSATGPIGGEFQVNTYTSNRQELFGWTGGRTVATDIHGNFVVVWSGRGPDGSEYGVFGQRYDASGATVGGEFQVNTYTNNDQNFPSVAMDDAGNFVVAWTSTSQDGSGYGVYAQRYDSGGNPLGGEFRVNSFTSSHQAYPSISMSATGNFIVAWSSLGQDSDGYGVYAQRYNASGVKLGSEFQVNTFVTGDQILPSVAANAAGDFVVAWESLDQDGSSFGIYAQRYDATGTPLGGEFQVNSFTNDRQQGSSAAMDGNGNVIIAWTSLNQDGSGYGIYAQRFGPSGAVMGGEFQINTFADSHQLHPSVAMNADGDTVVTWGSVQDGDGYGIYAQQYDASGTAVGGEFQVNSFTTGSQDSPSVAMTGTGDFVVAWNSDGQDGSSLGVFAQRWRGGFQAAPNIDHASIAITNHLDGANETLAATTAGTNITASYAVGVLLLSGSDTPFNYQQVLRSVTYHNASQNPATVPRVIEFAYTRSSVTSPILKTSLTIVSVNDAPTISATENSIAVDEGSVTANSGVFDDVDGSATLSVDIGTVVDNGNGTWSWSFSTLEGPAESQLVAVTATDDLGSSATASFGLTVNNVAPALDAVSLTPEVDENGSATLSGTFSDPGTLDTHAVLVNWGDGNSETVPSINATMVLTPVSDTLGKDENLDGEFELLEPDHFQVHKLELVPEREGRFAMEFDLSTFSATDTLQSSILSLYSVGGTPPGQASIEVFGYSGDGTVSADDLQAADMIAGPITDSAEDLASIDLTSFLQSRIDAGATHAGIVLRSVVMGRQTSLASANYLDPVLRPKLRVQFANRHTFTATHSFLDDNAADRYDVTITLTDDDNGVAVDTRQIAVRNVAPSIGNFEFDASIDTGGVATISGTISGAILDPGSLDTHQLSFDFGDGTSATQVSLESSQDTFSVTHSFLLAGTYSVQATLFDDDGGQATVSIGQMTAIGNVSVSSLGAATETGSNPGRFIVSQTVAAATDTLVSYSISGTAQSGLDFQPLSGTVTITAGTTNAQILVPVIDDSIDEGFVNESVVLTLQSIISGDPAVSLSTSGAQATIGIIDNDPDDDADGVGSNIEDPGGQGYDGNNDGSPDSLQSNVVSLPNANTGTYFTIAAEPGVTIADVVATTNPSPGDTPSGIEFAAGFLEYEIRNVMPGGVAVIQIFAGVGTSFTTYYKYGPTPDNVDPHWYEFLYDGTTGAEISEDVITLHFVDGQRGDDDLLANGVIVDPGGPSGAASPTDRPVPHAGGPYVTNEGSSIILDARQSRVSNPMGSLTYEWDLNYDGLTFNVEATGAQPTVSFSDNLAAHTIAVRVTDSTDVSKSSIATAALHVFNVAPQNVGIASSVGELVFAVGNTGQFSGSFNDLGTLDTHSAVWTFSHLDADGEIITETRTGTTTQGVGSGTVGDSFSFSEAGVYQVMLTISDDDSGITSSAKALFVVYDPSAGFVTGGGWLQSPVGAYAADPTLTGKANFGFNSKYKQGASVLTGNTEFQFKMADFQFKSTSYEWLVVSGAKARFRGVGSVNGIGDYGFELTAWDGQANGGDGTDRFRIKIWNNNQGNGVIYDNLLGAADEDDATAIGGGSIVIHKDSKLLMATDGVARDMVGETLTQAVLIRAVAQVIDAWNIGGIDAQVYSKLQQVHVEVADLSNATLGIASDTDYVWIDRDAAGYGWQLDTMITLPSSANPGMDLLSVVAHELGHKLGLEHSHDERDFMAPTLAAGMRRLAPVEQHSTAFDIAMTSRPGLNANQWDTKRLAIEDSLKLQMHDDLFADLEAVSRKPGSRNSLLAAGSLFAEKNYPGSGGQELLLEDLIEEIVLALTCGGTNENKIHS